MALDVERAIREHWGVRHMSFSTVKEDGRPRTTELDFVAHPSGLALCFRTLLRRQVAQDIGRQPYVSGNIVNEHFVGQTAMRSVMFEGTASLMDPGEVRDEFAELYAAKFGSTATTLLGRAENPNDFQFFGVNVTDWYAYAPHQEGAKSVTHHFQFPPAAGS